MKVVINRCYGGFSLSPKAVELLAERQGKPCYFFKVAGAGKKQGPVAIEEVTGELFWQAYTVPNPDEVAMCQSNWKSMSLKERQASDESWNEISLDDRPDDRADPELVAVVEELGDEASGECAELKIVEIPDGIEWQVNEYDGLEIIEEVHRSWS